MTIIRLIIRVAPFVALLLFIADIVVTNEVGALGERVQALEKKIGTLEYENELLSEQVASSSSLLALSERAREFGFVPPKQFMTIRSDQYPVAFSKSQ